MNIATGSVKVQYEQQPLDDVTQVVIIGDGPTLFGRN